MTAGTFKTSIAAIDLRMRKGRSIKPLRWQSIDVSKRPEAEMIEVTNVKFDALMRNEDLDYYRDQIKPNIPWADRHFELERVSGHPINPGITWREWPGGNSAAAFIEDGVFSHSYAERYWPNWLTYRRSNYQRNTRGFDIGTVI